ncbi:MAG: GGDEF domain-containing protein [Ruminococcus callidus]
MPWVLHWDLPFPDAHQIHQYAAEKRQQRTGKAICARPYDRTLNRRFLPPVPQQLTESKGKDMSVIIISADLDGLKHINDTYGHTEGDNAISTVGKALMTSAIQGEVCSRFGGDEFTVAGVIADMDDNYFESFRERFREYLRQYNQISRKHYLVESSIGFCFQKLEDEIDLDQMIKIADDRMYEDKVQRRKARR